MVNNKPVRLQFPTQNGKLGGSTNYFHGIMREILKDLLHMDVTRRDILLSIFARATALSGLGVAVAVLNTSPSVFDQVSSMRDPERTGFTNGYREALAEYPLLGSLAKSVLSLYREDDVVGPFYGTAVLVGDRIVTCAHGVLNIVRDEQNNPMFSSNTATYVAVSAWPPKGSKSYIGAKVISADKPHDLAQAQIDNYALFRRSNAVQPVRPLFPGTIDDMIGKKVIVIGFLDQKLHVFPTTIVEFSDSVNRLGHFAGHASTRALCQVETFGDRMALPEMSGSAIFCPTSGAFLGILNSGTEEPSVPNLATFNGLGAEFQRWGKIKSSAAFLGFFTPASVVYDFLDLKDGKVVSPVETRATCPVNRPGLIFPSNG